MTGTISVVIPTFEMASYLPALWKSLERSGIVALAEEVIVVDDGSRDNTALVLGELAADDASGKLRTLRLAENVGRFRARLEGARLAIGERILFLDTRLVLPGDFGDALARASARAASVMGHVDIDTSRNVFCLYWDRSHRFIFRKHYDDTRDETVLTSSNFDLYLKGTGVFLCERDLFVRCCERHGDLFSDDTLLMKEMVATTPILIAPDVRVQWVPRENAQGFLARIWERGPGFVEYHVLEHRGRLFWLVVAGGVVTVAALGLCVVHPALSAPLLGGALAVTAASTGLMAKTAVEAVRMAPLHVAVVATFGGSVVRGLVVNAARRLQRGHRQDTRAAADGRA